MVTYGELFAYTLVLIGMINNGEVEPNRISKTVLVIDEAQDMSKDDYALVSALMKANEEM